MKFRLLLAAAILVAGSAVSQSAMAQYAPNSNGNLANNLFLQYQTPSGASQTTAGMYPAPHWVPGNVGHTYYTYQALMPHEMLYQHSRNYYNYQAGPEAWYGDSCTGRGGGGSLNVTKVRWQSGCNHMGPLPFTVQPFQKRYYNFASRWYCIDGNCGGGLGLHRPGLIGSHGCASGNCGEEAYGDYYGNEGCGCATGDCNTAASQQSNLK
ncbi:MAG: hypothetical protein R3C03_22285 [Pirellulaceae bacterium]